MSIDLDQIFEDIKRCKIAVIGDVMLDTYWWGHVDRISPEAPVPVVLLDKKEYRLGGAGNVALNLQSLGAPVTLITVTGKDDDAGILQGLLATHNINTDHIVSAAGRTTTNKIRVISRNQQMMRLDAEQSHEIEAELETKLLSTIENYISTEKPQVIILQDYNKGVLTKKIIRRVIQLCRQHNIISAADPKRKNFFEYEGVDIFKPNLTEAKEGLNILNDNITEQSLGEIHHQLANKLHHSISLITLSDKGIFYQQENDSAIIAAHIRNVADVSGAGDTVIAVATLLYAVTKNVQLMAEMANFAGGLVCEDVGTAPINKEKFIHECRNYLSPVLQSL